jgi:hypothetical protein
LNPASATQPIREGAGLQNTIKKTEREIILQRQQGEIGMWRRCREVWLGESIRI